jgi:dienelactone hydrolase
MMDATGTARRMIVGRAVWVAVPGGCMSGDVASLAAEMTPYVSAAVAAYGGAVLAKVQNDVANATVGLGRRLLQRVFGSQRADEPLPGPLSVLAADPADADALAAVRLAIRQALAADRVLEADVRSMLVGVAGVSQQVRAGRDAYTAGRDQTIVKYRHPSE